MKLGKDPVEAVNAFVQMDLEDQLDVLEQAAHGGEGLDAMISALPAKSHETMALSLRRTPLAHLLTAAEQKQWTSALQEHMGSIEGSMSRKGDLQGSVKGKQRAKRAVIFRLDDVQDGWPGYKGEDGGASRKVIDVFNEKKVPLDIGVIGGKFFGNDTALKQSIDAALTLGSEVYNHGDDASTLFDEVPFECAQKHILAGMKDLFGEWLPYCYKSFVPHQNRWSESTLSALNQLGYKAISGSAVTEAPLDMKFNARSRPALLPTGYRGVGDKVVRVNTAKWNPEVAGGFESTIATVLDNCGTMPLSVPCVVMMHPMEFSDWASDIIEIELSELRDLIDKVVEAGWTVTTFTGFVGDDEICAPKPDDFVDTCVPPTHPPILGTAGAEVATCDKRCGVDWTESTAQDAFACPGGESDECPTGRKCFSMHGDNGLCNLYVRP